jgi:hypothetical protein
MPSAFRWPSASASSARQLAAGTIVSLRHIPDGDGPRERIGIRRDDGGVVYICWSKRILVLRQELEADGWLRRQLALLGACWCARGECFRTVRSGHCVEVHPRWLGRTGR